MSYIWIALLMLIAFIAGVLFGKANPNKAAAIKKAAEVAEKEAQEIVQKVKDGTK